jgi:hypothetical protein|tara:strand:+ start:537 stop:677 length:141 start_codon:yes stop_codon:yes gene_type:complete
MFEKAFYCINGIMAIGTLVLFFLVILNSAHLLKDFFKFLSELQGLS